MPRRKPKAAKVSKVSQTSRLRAASDQVELDDMLKQLDIDIGASDFEVDFELAEGLASESIHTPIDFSVSRELVPFEDNTEIRKISANRQLVQMDDYENLKREDLQAKRIVYPDMDDGTVINSFREIRTRLLQKSDGKNFAVMVVSLNKDMGTTFTSVNLGAVFAYEGGKTSLLLDCNQKESKLSKLLNRESALGLSDYINNSDIEVIDIIYPVGINRVRLIPAGTSLNYGLEIFGTERMKELVGVVKRRYVDRYLIIDAPPLEKSTDAAIISEIADYILIVVPYGKVSKNRLNKAIKSLPADKIAGFVLNNCKCYV